MTAILSVLAAAATIQGSTQLQEIQELTSRPMDTAAASRLLSIYEEGDWSARTYVAAHAVDIWQPFLKYEAKLPEREGWSQAVRRRVVKATASLADTGDQNATHALVWWSGSEFVQDYPGFPGCGVGLELETASAKALDEVDPTRLTPFLRSSDTKLFCGAASALKSRLPSTVAEACLEHLGSNSDLTRRCALYMLTQLDCTEDQLDTLAPALDDPSRVTRLWIGEKMPRTWIDHWGNTPIASRPVAVRVAMAMKEKSSTDEVLQDPAPEVASRGLLRSDGSPDLYLAACNRVLSSGPFPTIDARGIVISMVKRLGQDEVISLGLKLHTRLTPDFASFIALASATGTEDFDLKQAAVAARLTSLLEEVPGEKLYRFGGGPFPDWKPFVEQVLQSKFPATRALGFEALESSPPTEQAIRDHYTKALLTDTAPEIQAIARNWPWLDEVTRIASLSAWLSKQPRAVVLDAISDLQGQPLSFSRALLMKYSASSDPQIAEMARLTLTEALQGY